MKELKPRKVVVEWRYKPALDFYGKMDKVAMSLEGKFAHWKRAPLTVEVADKKRHCRFHLSSGRSFFEFDGPESFEVASKQAKECHKEFSKLIKISQYKRVGIRQTFALEFGHSFERLVKTLQKKLEAEDTSLAKLFPGAVTDVAYYWIVRGDDGWECNFSVGPMTKGEWFEKVPCEKGLYQLQGEGDRTLENYKKSLPENFVMLDVDFSQKDIAREGFDSLVEDATTKSKHAARQLIEHYTKG